ncbi:uncharacterized protein Dwil_GK15441 [Drosophila willistoni]|uniref:Uncharacterized protein n=1 Tax=Drosophila willistoni TaxID=7260 RepID=B4MV63_DROWI|nr:uncharacterized protein LOC6641865 [Drosophila willistoni]EDW76408.1 uncharacterized protein Dwil_GK15441 [Drosophila willistoni]
MVSAVKYGLALALIIGLASSAYAIKCYHCDSLTIPKCGLKFDGDDSLILDCSRMGPPRYLQNFFPPRNASGCMKKTLESAAGPPQIVRSCYFGDVTNIQSGCQPDPAFPFVRQLNCDVCTKDECNGSTSMTPIAFGIMMLFFGIARLLA